MIFAGNPTAVAPSGTSLSNHRICTNLRMVTDTYRANDFRPSTDIDMTADFHPFNKGYLLQNQAIGSNRRPWVNHDTNRMR